MSHYTKARAANYHTGLLTGSEADFLKLIKKYSICPPNNIGGYKGDTLNNILLNGQATAGRNRLTNTPNRTDDIRTAQVANGRLVAHIALGLQARGAPGVTGNEGGDRITFQATYDANPPATHVPVYFLPWDSDGAAVRITIPPAGTNNPDPNIFFTAAINGCSVFFQGTPDNPTIYHCGGSTGYAKAQLREAAEFWEEVMAEFLDHDTARHEDHGLLAARSVNKTEYVATPGVKAKADVVGAGGAIIHSYTTKRAKSYTNQLKAKHALGRLTVEEVSPWACVLGRRDAAGNWKFYLQENATVIYHRVTRSPLDLFRKQKSQTQYVARPLKVKEVFPAGASHVTVRSGLPKIH